MPAQKQNKMKQRDDSNEWNQPNCPNLGKKERCGVCVGVGRTGCVWAGRKGVWGCVVVGVGQLCGHVVGWGVVG